MTVLHALDRAKFEEKLSREARRFDLKPLLDLLIAKGYERDEMLFESTHEGTSSSSLVESIQFRKKPFRGILITLNLGLLGDNSLLPSYFFQVVEASRSPERFFDFIRFFDHLLIDNFLRAVYPEDGGAYTDHRLVLRSFFRMLGPGSESTLQWLVQLYFPELRVRVSRRAFESTTASHACRTGQSRLDGTGVIGRIYRSDATGFTVDLIADEETDSRGRGWAEIVEQRLEKLLLPLLAPFRLPLLVRLRVLYHASWAKVDGPFDEEHGYLGYDRLRGDPESGHTAILYRGVTGETKWAAHSHTRTGE